ncbi:MAG: prolipoprotein diacylglyceryl transferase family protein [Thermoguttaceae bacterium]
MAETDGFPIRGYGVFLTIAILAAGSLTIWRGKKLWNYPVDQLFSLLFVAAIFGIIGARVFYVTEYWQDYQTGSLRDTILNVINITNGGLVVYGSIIGGTIAAMVYLYVKKTPIIATLDLLIPAVILGVSIGRLGCLMNGCCFGSPCEYPWAITFPNGSPAYMQQLTEGKIPLYGITLSPAELSSSEDESNLFSLKTKRLNLASEIPSKVIVANVSKDSEAERAGILPGDEICEIGLLKKSATNDSKEPLDVAKIDRYRVDCNAQVFYFFLNIWQEDEARDVWLSLKNKEVANAPVRNVIFHPTPSKALPVHPTQIYSSINAFIIFCILLVVAKYARRDGIVLGVGMLLYPINRFCLELIRTDEESFCGSGLTVSQCVSVGIIILGILVLLKTFLTPPRRALEGYFPIEEVSNANSIDEKSNNVKKASNQ